MAAVYASTVNNNVGSNNVGVITIATWVDHNHGVIRVKVGAVFSENVETQTFWGKNKISWKKP